MRNGGSTGGKVAGLADPRAVAMLIMVVAGNLVLQICSRFVSTERRLLTFYL